MHREFWFSFALLLLAGCQAVPSARLELSSPLQMLEQADGLFPERSSVIAPADILTASPEIKKFVRDRISYGGADPQQRFRRLIQALQKGESLGLTYDSLETLSAAESFQTLRGNCLSLSILAFVMARESGLDAEFYEPHVDYIWDEQGDYHFLTRHISLQISSNSHQQWPISSAYVDFSGNPSLHLLPKTRLEERTVLAMFYNNRAADALARERLGEAYAHIRLGIQVDPGFAASYNTLGLILKRVGEGVLSEQAFRRGLHYDPDNYALLSSLYHHLSPSSRVDEQLAADYLRAERKQKNPFELAEKADRAFELGQYQKAIRLYQKAIDQTAYVHSFYFGIARSLIALKEYEKANRYLEVAGSLSPTLAQQQFYHRKVELLSHYLGELSPH